MTFEDLALALTGQGCMPCSIDRLIGDLDVVGMHRHFINFPNFYKEYEKQFQEDTGHPLYTARHNNAVQHAWQKWIENHELMKHHIANGYHVFELGLYSQSRMVTLMKFVTGEELAELKAAEKSV